MIDMIWGPSSRTLSPATCTNYRRLLLQPGFVIVLPLNINIADPSLGDVEYLDVYHSSNY